MDEGRDSVVVVGTGNGVEDGDCGAIYGLYLLHSVAFHLLSYVGMI